MLIGIDTAISALRLVVVLGSVAGARASLWSAHACYYVAYAWDVFGCFVCIGFLVQLENTLSPSIFQIGSTLLYRQATRIQTTSDILGVRLYWGSIINYNK